MFTPWNQICAVRFPTWGNFSFLSEKGVFQGYQAIPPGLAPWNPNRPATRMALGISAGRSGETLFHKGESIPLGLAPWNEVCAVRFPTWGNFSSVSGKGVFQRYQAIPLGIYIFSKIAQYFGKNSYHSIDRTDRSRRGGNSFRGEGQLSSISNGTSRCKSRRSLALRASVLSGRVLLHPF